MSSHGNVDAPAAAAARKAETPTHATLATAVLDILAGLFIVETHADLLN